MGIISKIYNKWKNRKMKKDDFFCEKMHEFAQKLNDWLKEYPEAEAEVYEHIRFVLCESPEYLDAVKNIIAEIPVLPLQAILKKLDVVTAAELKKIGIIAPDIEKIEKMDSETTERITIAGIDISDKAYEWSENYPDTPYPLRRQFAAALEKAETIEELQTLKKFLLEHKTELKTLLSHAQEPSGDNVADMAALIDECIAEKKAGFFITS